MKTIGNTEYNEEHKLGRGFFGTVYKGLRHKKKTSTAEAVKKSEEVKEPEIVAIKEVDLESFSVKRSPDTIRRETEILSTLSKESATHRNIVTLLGHEELSHYVYFIMEFCNGGNLKEYLQSKQKLDERTIKGFLRQITAGLKVAHDMRIVHRDLKPENILLCFSGPRYPSSDNIVLKIADFGVGRFLSDAEMAQTFCGSLLYMAPEVLYGRSYDYKVDLWCVGVIAYECLVGPLPINSRIALNGVEIPKNVSSQFAAVLKGLLETDENKRWNMKQIFNHEFLANNISVSVVATGKQTNLIQVIDNQTVDHLIDLVCAKFNSNSEAAYLFHIDESLERGSGNCIRESGVLHNDQVALVLRLSGGNDNGKMAQQTSFPVSYHNCIM